MFCYQQTFGAWVLVSLSSLLLSSLCRADSYVDDSAPIFSWVDKQGDLHATDRLADVPEPYYSIYQQRLREKSAAVLRPTSSPAASAVQGSVYHKPFATRFGLLPTTADEAARREAWQTLMRMWRQELKNAQASVAITQQHLEETAMNPILRETPLIKNKLAELVTTLDTAKLRVLAAQHMLNEALPKRARLENIPPAWLQDRP